MVNASTSRATLDNVEQCIDLALSKITPSDKNVNKVVLCLGTNDVTRNRDDSDQVNIRFTQAIAKVKQSFPESQLGVCSILPRKGKGQQISKINETTQNVNSFARKFCAKDTCLDYVDLTNEFLRQGNVLKSLFDTNDVSGVHISSEGEDKLCEMLSQYLSLSNTAGLPETPTMDRKRTRSETTGTPTSVDRKSKLSKTGTPSQIP